MEPRTLSIVIPALNEEAAIASTIERCLDARATLVERTGLDAVEVIVVNDGSTDRTEEIARGYEGITVLGFDENRGYGAAIKCGFEHGHGELVGFLDCDGTCDPEFFVDLVGAIDDREADLALGSRMGPESEMPLIRTIGNTLFAWILGLLSRQRIDDTASGMRVIRCAALVDLYPLPDGLHFTPAMTARALLERKLVLVEIPMPYAERLGRSKLSVPRDGLRFLSVIVGSALCYRPARPLLLLASLLAGTGIAVGLLPVVHYLRLGHLEEWMIYRVLLSSLLLSLCGFSVCGAVVAERIAAAVHQRRPAAGSITGVLTALFVPARAALAGMVLLGIGILVVWPGLVEFVGTGHVTMHWSRAVLSALLVGLTMMLGVATFLVSIIDLMDSRARAKVTTPPPDQKYFTDSAAS